MIRFLWILTVLFFLSTETVAHAQTDEIRFDRDIRPLLSNNCFHCHGPDDENREAELRLDIEEEAKSSAIVPGKPNESELYARLISDDPDLKMPPANSNKELTPEQIKLFKKWIEQGAKWKKHWSFTAPKQSPLPKVKANHWARNSIDYFILHRLEKEKLKPAKEADRRTLIRRLSFDLTGLPPKLDEVNAFVNDKSANAYEKLIDRLLKSPRYGERMAVNWLDAARYGDTSVYHADGFREMWAWRDRVVDSYNENLPFNQFSIEQLAGDMLPAPTIKQQIAAGFNRNNGTTDEGGLIPEEYRVEYAVDRVKTTATVWMGLTMECCQCHEHKYDPISQEDYYRFFAFFNVSADEGKQSRERNSSPLVKIADPEKEKQLPGVQSQLAELDTKKKIHSKSVDVALEKWILQSEKQIRKQKPVPKDISLHFPLNEGKDKSVVNSAHPEQKGEVRGKVDWVKARFGQGLKLDEKAYVHLGDVANYERTDSFSYGGWVWVDPKASGALLARMDDGNKNRGYDILINGDGKISVHLINEWPKNAIKVTTKKGIKPHQWNHIFAVYDGSSKAKGVQVYVNGVLWKCDTEKDGLTKSIKTDKSLRIGSRNPGSRLKGQVDDIQVYSRNLNHEEVQAIAEKHPLDSVLAIESKKRTDNQKKHIREFYLENEDAGYQELAKKYNALKSKEEELLKPLTTVMIMSDQKKPRDTFVLARGSYDSPTEKKVQPGTPPVLPPMTKGFPANRLGMAQWLFQDNHPLTARVAVNRYWQMLFGAGFVSTPEDFGSQGEFPTHPELLDWLAVDFRKSGWDVKKMIKQIVMSATYRQSSQISKELFEIDPENKLLARGARFRLQSEFIRDNALALGNLLVNKKGGPGVKTYQPPGLWKEVGLGGKPLFVQDHGEKLYRRSLYTYWKRSAPPPNMQIFDAPTREKCSVRRPRTNTPLQALVVLNDVQFVEASRNFAQRIISDGGKNKKDRAIYAFELATSRKPTKFELNVILEVLEHAQKRYLNDPKAAKKLISIGESQGTVKLDAAEHATWTVVANMILNLDETLTRE